MDIDDTHTPEGLFVKLPELLDTLKLLGND
jgi:hypothetical protein